MTLIANPFDLRTVLLAKHAQHAVLVHFPIGLFIAAVAFDAAALWTKRRGLLEAAYYNLVLASLSTIPVLHRHSRLAVCPLRARGSRVRCFCTWRSGAPPAADLAGLVDALPAPSA